MSIELLPDDNLEFLSLKGGYTGLSESTLVKKHNVGDLICLLKLFRAFHAVKHTIIHRRTHAR